MEDYELDNYKKSLFEAQQTKYKESVNAVVTVASILSIPLIALCIIFRNISLIVAAILLIPSIWIIGLIILGSARRERDNEISAIYKLKSKEDYEMHLKDKAEIEKEQRLRDFERKMEIENAKHPECPMCHNKNTERVSTAERAISIGTVGLASGKIGKQFYCKNCRYYW